jgi:hypothetical protein
MWLRRSAFGAIEHKNGGGLKKLKFKVNAVSKRFCLIALAVVAVVSVIGYAAVQYTLNVPSSVVVVKANPELQLIALDNKTVVTSISFGNVVQGETGTWSGYLNNTGNVDLHTFSIASPDIGSVGTVTWSMPVSGDLGVGQMCPVTIMLSINQTADVGSHTFTIQITGSPTITGPTNITITASDPYDPYLRYWGLMFDGPMPPIVSWEGYVGADVNEVHVSGDTMNVQWTLSAGTHYLIFGVTQTGGPSYGTYSGTITINGNTYSFSGVDNTHTVTIDFTL